MEAFVFLDCNINIRSILMSFKVKQLNKICVLHNIKVGKNKEETVSNLINDQNWNDGASVTLFIKNP